VKSFIYKCELRGSDRPPLKQEAIGRALHGYEVPEILALPVVAGLPAYLEWLQASTTAERATTVFRS